MKKKKKKKKKMRPKKKGGASDKEGYQAEKRPATPQANQTRGGKHHI
jgi:hypothetical protein